MCKCGAIADFCSIVPVVRHKISLLHFFTWFCTATYYLWKSYFINKVKSYDHHKSKTFFYPFEIVTSPLIIFTF